MIRAKRVLNLNEQFLHQDKVRKSQIRNLDKIECITKKLEIDNKFLNKYFKETLNVEERSIDLERVLKLFDLEYKDNSSNDLKFSLENFKKIEEILVNKNINCVSNKVSKPHLRKPYCRYHMMFLYYQEKLYENKGLNSSKKTFAVKNENILKINKIKKIDKFCSWGEKKFGEKVVTADDIIKSIHLILPFISVLIEFRESEINCIENQINNSIKIDRKSIEETTMCLKNPKRKDSNRMYNEKKLSDLNGANKNNEKLINKIKNSPGAKLNIDYVRKKTDKSPFGI